ncbi:hypothetical protein LWC35_09520 [Pseudonocardia kujensis]|uniref:hypothetical protein n=1 Tax=Pseudonocardia kujensis TaxID=1128675 RepID=UPI001E2A7EFC|nr:hypothetical protein [Pseudonocardia kujensis]MCE0763146.1 hypothetical protein [Pseudonocardia kujensis]
MRTDGDPDERSPAHAAGEPRRGGGSETRLPPILAVLAAMALYALLPDPLQLGPWFTIPAVELALLVALVATNPRRLTRETRISRWLSIALATVVVVTNLVVLVLLIRDLVAGQASDPGRLLLAALQVWATNVVGFALLYWEIDRDGPVARARRARRDLPPADWRFSQDENDDAVREVAVSASGRSGWVPVFVDYLYLSVTNSSAFSPTDTMPLSSRAKLLMSVQSTSALLVTLIIIARAVGAIQS